MSHFSKYTEYGPLEEGIAHRDIQQDGEGGNSQSSTNERKSPIITRFNL